MAGALVSLSTLNTLPEEGRREEFVTFEPISVRAAQVEEREELAHVQHGSSNSSSSNTSREQDTGEEEEKEEEVSDAFDPDCTTTVTLLALF